MRDTTISNLLSAGAGIGVAVTGYLAYKAGKNPEKGPKKFVAPIVSGALTIGAIWASNRVYARTLAGALGAAGYLIAQKKDLQKRVCRGSDWQFVELPKSAEETGNGHFLCLDGYSGRWFYSEPEAVDEAIKLFNENYEDQGYIASLNELYKALGITETHFGWQFGWNGSMDGYSPTYINFTTDIINIKGVEVYVFEPLSADDYPFQCWIEI